MRLHVKNLQNPPKIHTFFLELLLGLTNNMPLKKFGCSKYYNRKRVRVGGIHDNLLFYHLLLQKAFTKFCNLCLFHFGPAGLVRSENILKHFSCEKGYFHGALLLQDGELMAFSQKPLVERFPMPFSKLKRFE